VLDDPWSSGIDFSSSAMQVQSGILFQSRTVLSDIKYLIWQIPGFLNYFTKQVRDLFCCYCVSTCCLTTQFHMMSIFTISKRLSQLSSTATKQHSDKLYEMKKLLFGSEIKIKGKYHLALQKGKTGESFVVSHSFMGKEHFACSVMHSLSFSAVFTVSNTILRG
jgi:hypothetical protein